MPGSFSKDFETNKQYIDELFQVKKSFDLIYRVVTIGGRTSCFYFIDGFCKDEVMEKIIEFLYKITPDQMPETAHDFLKDRLPYGEIDLVSDEANLIQRMLSGVPILIIDGYDKFLAMYFLTYTALLVVDAE